MGGKSFHVAMLPWLGFGHLTPFLHLANKLAERDIKVSFMLPTKTQTKLEHLNQHPHLIHFIPLTVPHVDKLPPGAETTSDVPLPKFPLLMVAMSLMQDQVEAALSNLKPNLIFFDFAHWVPALARRLGIKSIHNSIIGASSTAHHLVPVRNFQRGQDYSELMHSPSGFPSSTLNFHVHEARLLIDFISREYINGLSFYQVLVTSMKEADAISFRTCREIEGLFCDYIESQYGKKVLLVGPALPGPPTIQLEQRWEEWLGKFKPGSVIYCALGSECILKKDQFQELVLGLEVTGLPFLAALKPPIGARTIEEALPEGFEERVKGRGVVHGGWVQQTLILGHQSVGCFMTHCGFSSMWESLTNKCQIVLLPYISDQFLNARMLSGDHLKVAVEVERREEDGWFTREAVCKAVKLVMDDNSKVASELRANHIKWRDFLLRPGLESLYIDSFVQKLHEMFS